ncbi:hypothetical protein CHARACLAT_020144 [Characodon lateralis]|uniref:Uncharacterized protein n=1 Tax=Characodon lateralis TaxID=208331 RepID=A0ABU7CPX3_9TELE|nr:hypothetical protein [Characodon lateralis]
MLDYGDKRTLPPLLAEVSDDLCRAPDTFPRGGVVTPEVDAVLSKLAVTPTLRCWSSQVCWVIGATCSTDYHEEHLSRRLPALQCESVLLPVILKA